MAISLSFLPTVLGVVIRPSTGHWKLRGLITLKKRLQRRTKLGNLHYQTAVPTKRLYIVKKKKSLSKDRWPEQ